MSGSMRGFEGETLSAAWHAKRVWLTHVLLNAALLVAFSGWLLIPDRRGWQVASSFLLGLIWLTIALWLYAATLQYFTAAHAAPESWTMSWRRSARNIPAFAICFAIFFALMAALAYGLDKQSQLGGWFHHLMPAWARSRVSVRAAVISTHVKLAFFFFGLVPVYFFPFIREGALRGFGAFTRGWASAARSFWHIRFWLLWIVLFLVGHLPIHLIFAKPQPGTVTAQAASMVLRLGAAYLILVTVFMVLFSALGRLRRDEAPAVPEPVPIETAPRV